MSLTTIRYSGVPENTHSAASDASTASWRIGEKPYDPLDPGPYGTPGWQPDPRRGRRRRGELPDPPQVERRPSDAVSAPSDGSAGRPEADAPHDFSPMREAAYRDFLRDSEELHLAHLEPPQPNRVLVYLAWYLRVVIAILYWRVIPFPERPSRCRRARTACEARQSNRYVGRAAVVPIWGSAYPTEPREAASTGRGHQSVEPPPAIPVEWRTVARPVARPVAQLARPAVARPADPPRSRPPLRPHPVMAPRNRALSRRRAETRRIFLHTYSFARDENFRNLNWPKGSWEGYDSADLYPTNPRRGAIRRRHNRRPRNLALARSFPASTPAIPVGATSRPAPVGPTVRLLPLAEPMLPSEALIHRLRSAAPHRSRSGPARTHASGGLR